MIDKFTDFTKRNHVELREGIVKTVMSYGEDTMVCHIALKQGTRVEPHSHEASQNGYVISGKFRLIGKDGEEVWTAHAGCGYYMEPWETHGVEVLEDTEIIEVFSPLRREYIAD